MGLVCSYIEGTSQRQEFQNVRGHVGGFQMKNVSDISGHLDTLLLGLFRRQVIDSYIPGDSYFLSRLELFQLIMQENNQSFSMFDKRGWNQ